MRWCALNVHQRMVCGVDGSVGGMDSLHISDGRSTLCSASSGGALYLTLSGKRVRCVFHCLSIQETGIVMRGVGIPSM